MSQDNVYTCDDHRDLGVMLFRVAVLLSFSLLSMLFIAAYAAENESYSMMNYTFEAAIAPSGHSYIYQWVASDGYPLSSTDRVFKWRAPEVHTRSTVFIDLVVSELSGGCAARSERVVTVIPLNDSILFPESNLSVIKRAVPESAIPGQVITYSYTVTNNGRAPVLEISLTDDKLGPVAIDRTSLSPGQSASGELRYTAARKDLPGPLVNLATAEGRDRLGRTIRGAAEARVIIHPIKEPGIRISKGCIYNDPVRIGDQVVYTYNITNTGDLPLTDVNVTDVQEWGPCCTPVYLEGDDGNQILDPSETWSYTCPLIIHDPLNYQKLTIQSSREERDEVYMLRQSLERLKLMLQFRMQKMIRLQSSFETSRTRISTDQVDINGSVRIRYNYTSRLTGAVLSRVADEGGRIISLTLTDPISDSYIITEYSDSGQVSSHTFFANKTREYQRVEYDSPMKGFKTIITADLKTGDTITDTVDPNGIVVSREYRKTPGMMLYEEMIWLRNTATVTAKDSLGDTVADFDSFLLEIHRPLPRLLIDKVADPDPAVIGQVLNYTITYENAGDEAAWDVVIKESYDRNVTFVSANPVPDGGTIDRWSIGDLDIGSSGLIRVTVMVPMGFNSTYDEVSWADPTGRVVRNTVNISCAQGIWKNITLNTTAINRLLPGINLTKSYVINNNISMRSLRPGDAIEYGYRVNNTGNISLKWLSLKDDKLGPITLDKAALSPGEVALGRARYVVKESDLPGPLVNNASINATPVSQLPGVSTNVTDHDSVWIPISGLNITKEADKSAVRVGDLVNYTYAVRNSGSGTIILTGLEDRVDKNGRTIDVRPDPAGVVLLRREVLWFNGTYLVTEEDLPDPIRNTPLNNTATVRGRDSEGSEVNASARASVDVLALNLVKTAERETIGSGDVVRYNYTVTNTGSGDIILAGLTDNRTADVDDPSGTWLESEESASFFGTYTIKTGDGDLVVNQATISGDDKEGNTVNASATASVRVAMRLLKYANKSYTSAGETIGYRYIVWNNGTSEITLNSLVDDLVEEITPGPAGVRIPPGQSKGFEGSYYVMPSDAGRPIINYATATGTDAKGLKLTSQATASVNTSQMRLTKIPDKTVVAIGDTVKYSYKIENLGPADITITWFNDELTRSQASVDFIESLDDIRNNIIGIVVASRSSVLIPDLTSYQVAEEDLPGPLVNNATVWAEDYAGNNLSASTKVSVVPSPLQLSKTADLANARVGDIITYTFVVTNKGTSTIRINSLNDNKTSVTPPQPLPFDLAAGETSQPFVGTYAVEPSDLPGPIINMAVVTGINSQSNEVSATATYSVNIIQGALGMTKVPDRYIYSVGDIVTYTYTVHNYNDPGLHDILLTDFVDEIFIDATGSHKPVTIHPPVPTPANPIPIPSGTDMIFTGEYEIQPDDESPLLNRAEVKGTYQGNPVSAKANATVDPALMLTKTPDKISAYVGENITYTYVVTNKETFDIELTSLTDDKVLEITPDPAGRLLESGESLTFTGMYTVKLSDWPRLDNIAEVIGVIISGDHIGVQVKARATATVTINTAPAEDIGIYKTANRTFAKEGDVIRYRYVVKNLGKKQLNDPDITLDSLADDLVRSITPQPRGTVIEPGSYRTFYGYYTVTGRDYASSDPCNPVVVNKVKASGKFPSGRLAEGFDQASVRLMPASASLTKTASTAIAKVGQEIVYNYTIVNTGGMTLRNIKIEDDKLGVVSTVKRELEPGEMTTGTAKHKVTALDLPGPLRNNATVETSVPLCGGANATAEVDLISLTINKTASVELTSPGSTFYYLLTFRNSGSGTARDVLVKDLLDPSLEFDPIRGAIPAPTDYNLTDQGMECEWRIQSLAPGEERSIEMVVRVKDEVPEGKELIINNYKIDSPTYDPNLPYIKHEIQLVNRDLWVTKKADKSTYAPGSEIVYTINYGNRFDRTAHEVTLGDTLPDVEYLFSTPSPSLARGKLLLWNLGELPSKGTGTITVTVRIPRRPNMTYDEESFVSGTGYAYESKHLTTGMIPQSLLNRVNISGYYIEQIKGVKIRDGSNATVCSSVVHPGTTIRVLQHGSGFLEQEELVELRVVNRSIRVDRDTFAQHADTQFTLPGGRVIPYRSQWSDWTRAKNDVREEALSESSIHMDTIEKQSSFLLDENQTVYKSTSDFDGGIATIRYHKREPNTKRSSFEVEERYHGSFKVQESLDSYGSGVAYAKSALGGGFVASDKRPAGQLQRSFEQGSGSYDSDEIINTGTTVKSSAMNYVPNVQAAGGREIYYGSKWHEEMRTRDPDQGSSISEVITSADRIEKDSLMEKSNLAIFGEFNGTAEIRAEQRKIPNPTHTTGIKDRTAKNEIVVDQVLTGDYKIDTTISIHKMPKYVRPHINITKRAKRLSDDIVLFKINVTNDGNKTLGPVEITDALPEGMTFVNSSLRPKVEGNVLKWTILSLQIAKKQSIDLRVRIGEADANTPFTNAVHVVGIYGSGRIVEADGSCTIVLDNLPRFLAGPQTYAQLYNTSPAYLGGEGWGGGWMPPEEMGLCSNATYCPVVKDSECSSCPVVVQLETEDRGYSW